VRLWCLFPKAAIACCHHALAVEAEVGIYGSIFQRCVCAGCYVRECENSALLMPGAAGIVLVDLTEGNDVFKPVWGVDFVAVGCAVNVPGAMLLALCLAGVELHYRMIVRNSPPCMLAPVWVSVIIRGYNSAGAVAAAAAAAAAAGCYDRGATCGCCAGREVQSSFPRHA